MNRVIILLLTALLLCSCVSVRHSARKMNALHNPGKLRSDVDFVYTKLQKLHPRLYQYTGKWVLDYKFDSLKSSFTTPMTSNDFFFKLSPVIAQVRQGHVWMEPLVPETKTRISLLPGLSGKSPLSCYDLEIFDNRLYLFKNYTGNQDLKPGTELVTLNGQVPADLISKFRPTRASDGYNQTFIERSLNKKFTTWYHYRNGISDSILCQVKYNDTISTIWLKGKNEVHSRQSPKSKEPEIAGKAQRRAEKEKNDEQGYDRVTKTYSKELTFATPDSTIAILTVKDFVHGDPYEYYKKCFRLLDTLKAETLILDLRDNPGGVTGDASQLFSYLVDTTCIFTDVSEVASKYSLARFSYFRGNPLLINMILAIGYPMHLILKGVMVLVVHKGADNKYYFPFPGSTVSPKKRHFKGNLYVLINGGTFSAAAILASNLQGLKKGVFIGEETGGASNGTVAGKMAIFKLPESKLKIHFGLAYIQPHYHAGSSGHGVMPDVSIKPTLEDRINGVDPEIEWVLESIKKE